MFTSNLVSKVISKYLTKVTAITLVVFSPVDVLFLRPNNALASPSTSSIQDSPKEVIDQVWQIVYRDFLDSTGQFSKEEWIAVRNKMLRRSYLNPTDSYEAIEGMLSLLEDPYTRFLNPKEFNEMRIDTSGELSGVGIQLSVDEKTNQLVVISPIEDTPASKAGVSSNDVIVSIDGKSTEGMSIETAVKLIRGKSGTKVVLVFLRQGQLIKVPLLRARIEISSVNTRLNTSSNGYKIGYIRLKQFNAKASKEMSNALIKLESVNPSGYILDLRSNPGGLLESSIDIARQWLNKGIIVSTETRGGVKDIRRAKGRALTKKPLVVLVNEGSASASEILSGAIQDNQRGLLVGKKTFGKGLVQSVRGLSDGSGLTVTIAKYLTPNGVDIHKNGIEPDVYANLSKNPNIKLKPQDLGTSNDNQYIVAEQTLIKLITKSNKTTYYPYGVNLIYALVR